MDDGQTPDDRIRVRRNAQRGRYDRATVDAVLDAALVAHVGFVADGRPVVLPMVFARDGDRVLLHGSTANRMARTARTAGLEVCVTVTVLDGLVVARSAFHCSMNYRSVVVHGTAHEVTDPADKRRALDLLTDHVLPGHIASVRPHHELEIRATTVLALSLELASAKIRTGPPVDDPDDIGPHTWGGVVPVRTVIGDPVPDDHVNVTTPVPAHVAALRGTTGS